MKGLKTVGGPRKAKYDIAPQIRAAFLAAIGELERRSGKTFAQMMAEWMQKDPIAVLNMVAKFTERESEINARERKCSKGDGLPATDALLERFLEKKG